MPVGGDFACNCGAEDCVKTVCVTRCDDTTGDGSADTTYSELWCIRADGTATLVLTYQADPATPYVPVSPVECTYGNVECETLTLCDDSGAFLRRYRFLSDGTATFEDVALDGQTPHVVTGDVGACTEGGGTPCAEPTTPAATLGLCLPDGTPLAVLVTRDCDGAVTQDGWLNLATGQFTTGPPPAGAAACGDSRAYELAGVLCDTDPATGGVINMVLLEYAYNADGSLASVTILDAATGQPYILQGELRRCPGDAGAQLPEQDLTVLCDTAADGTVTAFVRDYRRDPASGQIAGHTDYTLTGQPYTPAGTVGVCQPAPEPCRDTSTLLVCDLPTGGTPDATVTDTDPTPYYPYPTGAPVAGAQTLWDGGTLDLAPGTGPQPGTTGTVNSLAATVQAPRPGCDTGTARVAVTVNVQQTGPDDGCGQVGHLRLFVGTTQTALTVLPANTPNGWFGALTVEADVPAADLAAGNVAVALALDAYDDNPTGCAPSPRRTGWQLSGLAATVAYDQTGCETQILRTVLTDCDTGETVSVTDTTLDGQPYTVTGEVGQCTAAGGAECCPPPEPEPCRNTSTLLVCDVPQDGEPAPAVTDTPPGPYEAQAGTEPVAGGAAALWSGGTLTIPPDTAPPPDGAPQFLRTIAGTVRAPRPACDTGTATVTVTLRAERTGPDPGCLGTAFVQLLVGGTAVASDSVVQSTPVGHVEVLTLTAQVPAADLAAGNVALYGAWETYHRSPTGCPGSNADGAAIGGWTLDQFATDVVYDQDGCAAQILASVVTDCATGEVQSITYTTTGGQPYTPVGEIGQCTPAGGGQAPPEPCRNPTALLLCDTAVDATPVTPDIADATVANTDLTLAAYRDLTPPYTALWSGGSLAFPADPDGSAGDGVQVYRAATGRVTAAPENCTGASGTLTASVRVTQNGPGAGSGFTGAFRIYRGTTMLANQSVTNAAPAGHVQTLTVTAPVTAEDLAGGDLYVVLLLETFQGTPKAWTADQFTISGELAGCRVQFMRTLVTDCATGETISVTDTTLDGQPYTVTGEVGQCAPASSAPEPCPAQSVIEACRCDDTDGDGAADAEYVELLAVDCAGALTSLGTYLPDLSGPYTPVAPVDCDTGGAGAPAATGVQARRVQLDPGETWSAAAHPTLQSVTAVAHGGTGTITTQDGPSTLHDTETATWSVVRDTDALLTGPLTITADTGTITITWTQGVTL